ncbi:MAG: hypothetical protein IPF67_10180 [Saprospiraceae bacterium]|nr:hypothetical protein [Candidatus Brachybacter algidus]
MNLFRRCLNRLKGRQAGTSCHVLYSAFTFRRKIRAKALETAFPGSNAAINSLRKRNHHCENQVISDMTLKMILI